eukprot:4720069-Pleurochrysis_carterae.AAC.1
MCKWGHPVATLPSNEGDYTSLVVGHTFCKSPSKRLLPALVASMAQQSMPAACGSAGGNVEKKLLKVRLKKQMLVGESR